MNRFPYGQTFALWRAGCPEAWQTYTHHDFVAGLGAGTLPRSAFLHYLIQDYVFLVHFSRAWSLAVVKAETVEEMKICAATVDALVNHEMALHVKTCAAEGIDETSLFNATEEFENLAYTRYVMDAGLQGSFLDLMAALAPCCFGYGEIGLRLKKTAAKGTPYQDWIKTYADGAYQEAMANVGRMIDRSVLDRLGTGYAETPMWPKLQDHFTTATRLEAAFWDMGLRAA
ncbi:MAG: thiaminase II [Roseobacter sp.]